MSVAPVAIFAYNRADHLAQTIEHLRRNEGAGETDVYLFSDAPKGSNAEQGVREVRELARQITGFRNVTVVERETNWGLLRSMIDGVGEIATKYGRVIVVEDDIVTAPCFLNFMNKALEFYEGYRGVGSISGYLAPSVSQKLQLRQEETFFHYRTNCWGWATWGDRWSAAQWEPQNWRDFVFGESRQLMASGGSDLLYMMERSFSGKNQSWMARWYYHCMMHGMLTLYPARSLTGNIGFDGTGTHSLKVKASAYDRYRTNVEGIGMYTPEFVLPVTADPRGHKLMRRFWDAPWWMGSPTGLFLKKCYTTTRSALTGARR